MSDQTVILSVSELTLAIRGVLESAFRGVWVRGEISNFVVAASGHYYFTLKDASAQLKAVCFRSAQRRTLFQPRNGQEVLAFGKVSVYEPRGEYQLIVEELQDYGLGRLMQAFEQLKSRLQQKGYFDPARKKPLPMLPARVGVVTSPTGAAIRDILQVMARRSSSVQVLIFPVRVQGEGAAAEIAAGIRYFDRRGGVDVLIVGRGGGSLEDLWAFNEEIVAEALHECRIPVISAVGHEVDFTIADFVADVRAPTPSAAAELVAAASAELARRVDTARNGLRRSLARILEGHRHRLAQLRSRSGFASFGWRLQTLGQRVDELELRLRGARQRRQALDQNRLALLSQRLGAANPCLRVQVLSHRWRLAGQALESSLLGMLSKRRNGWELLRQSLASLNPRRVLERGYALCLDERGQVVRSYRQLDPGQEVQVLLREGLLDCRVEDSRPDAWPKQNNSTG